MICWQWLSGILALLCLPSFFALLSFTFNRASHDSLAKAVMTWPNHDIFWCLISVGSQDFWPLLHTVIVFVLPVDGEPFSSLCSQKRKKLHTYLSVSRVISQSIAICDICLGNHILIHDWLGRIFSHSRLLTKSIGPSLSCYSTHS